MKSVAILFTVHCSVPYDSMKKSDLCGFQRMKDAQSIANKEIAIAKTAKVISRADAPEE